MWVPPASALRSPQHLAARRQRPLVLVAFPHMQANKAQLTGAVAAQVEATKSGLDCLNRAHGALLKLRENFATITRLCAECQSLIDCHDKIQALSAVHTNLRKTLQVQAGWGAGWRGRLSVHAGTLGGLL